MKSLSVKLVLITVLLQLFLSVLEVNAGKGGGGGGGAVGEVVENENQLRFGDLLVTPNFSFSHYAVYVGNVPFHGKTDDNHNIFEMMKPDGCRFDRAEPPFRRHNYLDPGIAPPGGQSRGPQNRDQMRETIQNLMCSKVCRTYSLFKRNCEQIATRVRYGESHCMQLGTAAEPGARMIPSGSIQRREASAAA